MERVAVDPGALVDARASSVPGATACRHCGAPLSLTVVDLGKSPLCQTVLTDEQLEQAEAFYPLHVRACERCWLVQIPQFVPPEDIFTEYAYFSAYSDSWVEHARRYVDAMTERLALGPDSLVVEVASNDGYLLQHFLPKGVPVLGIEPALNVADAAVALGVETVTEFFGADLGRRLAAERRKADLVLGNNVLAQVPDINDFVEGVAALLAPGGTATFEFPHLAKLVEHLEYDTIYHEHFSYFSLHSIRSIFGAQGLDLVDVEELPSHGGSLRVFLRHAGTGVEPSAAVAELLDREDVQGMRDPATYRRFAEGVRESKRALLELLIGLRRDGKQVVGYGAPGKGNTLLNYCGIRTDFLDYTVDRNPYKQGKHTPGTHIPIHTARADRGDQAGRHRDPAVEPRARDQRAARLHRGVGSTAGRAGPDRHDVRAGRDAGTRRCVVKVVVFCGGLGVRMGEATQRIPKPMILIGNRPILWHIMRYYAAWGHTEFVLCLGYKGDVIREYFLNYNEALFNDFVLEGHGADARIELLERDVGRWRITFVDTGMQSTIGERLKAVEGHLNGDEMFFATYGDGLTDAPLDLMLDAFRGSGKLIQFLSVRPQFNAHRVITADDGTVMSVEDMSLSDVRINGGFFTCRRELLDWIEPGDELVEETFAKLIPRGEVIAYPYEGFFGPMDTIKDRQRLEGLHESGRAPWRLVGDVHDARPA